MLLLCFQVAVFVARFSVVFPLELLHEKQHNNAMVIRESNEFKNLRLCEMPEVD